MQISEVQFPIIQDVKTRENILRDQPFQLIKFKPFKRNAVVEDESEKRDRRLTRTKNRLSLPVGAWAGSVVSNKRYYQTFIMCLIVGNTISIGIDAELSPNQNDHWALFQFLAIFDLFTVCIFVIDILLKWVDNFKEFWKVCSNIYQPEWMEYCRFHHHCYWYTPRDLAAF